LSDFSTAKIFEDLPVYQSGHCRQAKDISVRKWITYDYIKAIVQSACPVCSGFEQICANKSLNLGFNLNFFHIFAKTFIEMKNFILLSLFVFIVFNGDAQNVGQEGDTLLNYTDINGLKQGHWKKTYDNGAILYETYFVDNKPVGNFKRYDKSGYLAVHMVYEKEREYARATFYHSNGKPAGIGNYQSKNKDSIWNYFSDGGILYLQESYKNGIKHGAFRQLNSEKVLIEETNWNEGVKHGSWKKFFQDGEIMWESNYVNGKLEGKVKSYYKSGKVYKEGAFKNDLMEGEWRTYDENGVVEKVYQYTKGVSPAAVADDEEMMKELYKNKDQIEGPRNANDVDWLRGVKEY
jgi:antitoxin component YwqK of YwqJK toxin-antitoxin module